MPGEPALWLAAPGVFAGEAGRLSAPTPGIVQAVQITATMAVPTDESWTVQAQIGGGGMADVFRATDEELGVDVAIKLLKPRMASDELRARMVQEAQAAAQVRHANLVRVFSTGKLDRTAYIVMELLDGPNLKQYLREHPDQRLPWDQALTLMLPALDALHAIHERGYIHRDIKAGNILVTREPGCSQMALVIDLGLVKADARRPPKAACSARPATRRPSRPRGFLSIAARTSIRWP